MVSGPLVSGPLVSGPLVSGSLVSGPVVASGTGSSGATYAAGGTRIDGSGEPAVPAAGAGDAAGVAGLGDAAGVTDGDGVAAGDGVNVEAPSLGAAAPAVAAAVLLLDGSTPVATNETMMVAGIVAATPFCWPAWQSRAEGRC
jgi:hypothetical protein